MEADESYIDDGGEAYVSDDASDVSPKRDLARKRKLVQHPLLCRQRTSSPDPLAIDMAAPSGLLTPRTKHILAVINSRDVAQIKKLVGVGPKKAEGICQYLVELDEGIEEGGGWHEIRDWEGLRSLKGLGSRGLDLMREGVAI